MEKNNKQQLDAINVTFDKKLTNIKTEFMKVYNEVKKKGGRHNESQDRRVERKSDTHRERCYVQCRQTR